VLILLQLYIPDGFTATRWERRDRGRTPRSFYTPKPMAHLVRESMQQDTERWTRPGDRTGYKDQRDGWPWMGEAPAKTQNCMHSGHDFTKSRHRTHFLFSFMTMNNDLPLFCFSCFRFSIFLHFLSSQYWSAWEAFLALPLSRLSDEPTGHRTPFFGWEPQNRPEHRS
jgi:hypothetical protein